MGETLSPIVTIAVGAIVGFLVGLTSVGSGTLIIVALAFLFPRLSSKESVRADISHAVMLHIAATVAYFNAGTINWTLVLLLRSARSPAFSWEQTEQVHPRPHHAPHSGYCTGDFRVENDIVRENSIQLRRGNDPLQSL